LRFCAQNLRFAFRRRRPDVACIAKRINHRITLMASTSTTQTSNTFSLPAMPAAHWLIRLSVAGTFLFHGVEKLPALEAGASFFGLPLWLWTLVAVMEVAAGLAILAGPLLRNAAGDLLTRLAGLTVAVTMVGAIYLVHWGQWSNIPSETHPAGGMEFQTLLLATGLFFALRGNEA
jgi:putative oxidoreductase